MLKKILFFIILGTPFVGVAQDMKEVRRIIHDLSKPQFHGRGYVNDGQKKAADYIARRYEKSNLTPLYPEYFQNFTTSINTFPGKMKIELDQTELKPGYDYLVDRSSPSVHGNFPLIYLVGEQKATNLKRLQEDTTLLNQAVVVIDQGDKALPIDLSKIKGIMMLKEGKLSWSIVSGHSLAPLLLIEANKEVVLKTNAKEIKVDIEATFEKDYSMQNVVGVINGKKYPEQYLIIGAHYDHLGQMGKHTYFPGAHDNASGVAMLLSLAEYFGKKENQSDYSLIFMAFAGEEAGLLGSKYAAKHLPVEKEKIKMMLNIDLMGSGSEGIMVVNALKEMALYNDLVKINNEKHLLPAVKKRGEACNSDHCPFVQEGIPAVFLYTLGKEYLEYHNPDDKAKGLPLTGFKGVFQLLKNYIYSPV